MNFSLNCVIKYILLSFYFLATKEHLIISNIMASLVVQTVKNPPNNVRDRVRSWVGKIPWQSRWQPTPVFLPGEYHGQRNLAGYSPWGCKELDTTERLTLSQTERLTLSQYNNLKTFYLAKMLPS